jgi:hypothetical protein
MKPDKHQYAYGALTNREHELIVMFEPTAISDLKARFGMTYEEAKAEMKRIKEKLKAYQEHEQRQEERGARINLANIASSIRGTDEKLIMSEV